MASNTFLDKSGLDTLWSKIGSGFTPRWQAYKPGERKTGNAVAAEYSMTDDKDCLESTQSNVIINFNSAGRLTSGETVYGNDIRLVLTPATPSVSGSGGNAGLLSAQDKETLDRVGSDIENAITIKGEKVNGTELTLTNKYTNWNLVYNSETNTLDIVDKNNSNTVLTSVNVNDFIGEVFKDGFITDVSLVDKDDNNTSGTFIKLVFALTKTSASGGNTEYTKTLYLNVSDLIDVYTAGTGISLSESTNSDIDNTPTSTTINLKSAATTEIGGIKVKSTNTKPDHHSLTDAANRYFSLEKDENDFGFVNVPICELEITGSANPSNPATINVADGGKLKFVSEASVESTTEKHTVALSYNEIEIAKETSVTAVAGTTDTTSFANSPKHASTFTAITDITPSEKNGHELKLNKTTFKFPTISIVNLQNDNINPDSNTIPNETITAFDNEVRVLSDIEYDSVNDRIIKTYKDLVVEVASIDISIINALVYPVS